MSIDTVRSRKDALRSELASAHAAFHSALDSLSDEGLRKPSINPAWSNNQVLFHMAFGFFLLPTLILLIRLFGRLPRRYSRRFALVLNTSTVAFHWINAMGPRVAGSIFSRRALGKTFDWVHAKIMRILESIPEEELALGMYYPDRWEPLFHDYMTLEDLFHYPTTHLLFHLKHLSV